MALFGNNTDFERTNEGVVWSSVTYTPKINKHVETGTLGTLAENTEVLAEQESLVLAAANRAFEADFISIERTKDPTIWKAVMRGGGYYPIDVLALDNEMLLRELGLVEPEQFPEDPVPDQVIENKDA